MGFMEIFQRTDYLKMLKLAFLFWQLVALSVTSAHQWQKIHERMTSDERQQVFNTIGDNVPDYEMVEIHWPRVEKRSAGDGKRMHLKAFGKNIELWLTPADRVLVSSHTPVYTLNSGLAGPILTRYRGVLDAVQRYEDMQQSAVITINERNETPTVFGHIASENLVIAPIPQRLIEEVNRQRRSVDDLQISEDENYHHHIAYKTVAPEENTTLSIPVPKNVNRVNLSVVKLPYGIDLKHCTTTHRKCIKQCGNLSRINEDTLDTLCGRCQFYARAFFDRCPLRGDAVYPRILVVVAHDYYKKFNQDDVSSLAYLLAFWNGVDLKFRSFENPKIRLNIAGIVLTKDATALECLENNIIDGEIRYSRKTAEDCGKYWYARKNDIPFDNYDIIMTMTSYKLCRSGSHHLCKHEFGGIGMLKGACARLDSDKQLFNIAIIQGNAGFTGISKAAHVLGHLFGAGHGGDQIECLLEERRLRTAHANDKYGQWSDCSLSAIQDFLDSNPTCLNHNPNPEVMLPVYLPGKFFDVDQQCYRLGNSRACRVDDSICKELRCVTSTSEWKCETMQIAAADGTSCGRGTICLSGQCVQEPIFV